MATFQRRRGAQWGARCALAVLAAVFAAALFGGCAQNTEAPVEQATDQTTAAPASNQQEQATQGSQVYVWIENAPGSRSPSPGATVLDAGDGFRATAMRSANTAGGNEIADARAGYLQSGITVHITTGGTTPSATGTSTASATGTQTASAAPNQTANQEPRASVSIPISTGVGGSAPSANASSATDGGQSEATQTNQQTAMQQQIRAMAERLAELESLLHALRPASPATQPAGN